MAEEEVSKMAEEEEVLGRSDAGVRVSLFDDSVENHFKAMDTISRLCGEAESESVPLDEAEIQRLSSSITFLREWRHFNYEPTNVRFARETEGSRENGVPGGINMPQFSSATFPQEIPCPSTESPEFSKDFVMYVGGCVWALDWCPRVHKRLEVRIKREFIAIAAHPPGSYYHRVGTPLTGRGVVQIWCVLNICGKEEEECPSRKRSERKARHDKNLEEKSNELKRSRGQPSKKMTENLSQPKRPRGRPRKKPLNEFLDSLDCNNQHIQAQHPEDSSEFLAIEGISKDIQEQSTQNHSGRKRKCATEGAPACDSGPKITAQTTKSKSEAKAGRNCDDVECPLLLTQKEGEGSLAANNQIQEIQVYSSISRNNSSQLLAIEGISKDIQELSIKKKRGRKAKAAIEGAPLCDSSSKKTVRTRRLESKARAGSNCDDVACPLLLTQKEGEGSLAANNQILEVSEQELQVYSSLSSNDSSQLLAIEGISKDIHEQSIKKKRGREAKSSIEGAPLCDSSSKITMRTGRLKTKAKAGNNCADVAPPLLLTQKEGEGSFTVSNQIGEISEQDLQMQVSLSDSDLFKDIAMPRLALCLAHNGKVAWDVKWRPHDASDPKYLHRLGYLAALLGNGSLEVWDVPLPHAMKMIYSSSHREGTDPRFVKLEPVFKCSTLKCGGTQSIPLTLEWSTSYPNDYLLAGCHDGKVALWKFPSNGSSGDTRPLLCFSADTVPIRAVAWAPVESDRRSASVIVTAGHSGLKFWDLRDPFRPLWEFRPLPKFIYSLDWLADPRCIILSFDDGTMKLLSLVKAAYNAPVNGTPTVGPKQYGIHALRGLSFAVWSVQVSRLTGMVAYCGADGTVCRFQLTTKVEKDPARNSPLHFICGSLTISEDDRTVVVNTPLQHIPPTSKKLGCDVGNNSRTSQGFLSESYHPKGMSNNRAKFTEAENQPPVLSYGHDPDLASEAEETLAVFKRKNKAKSKSDKEKKLGEDQISIYGDEEQNKDKDKAKSINRSKEKLGEDRALICRDKEQDTIPKRKGEMCGAGNGIKVVPHKLVAVHRVRWNMNKGSERWLCSGGAAGIVRCQEIVFSVVDNWFARKR